MEVEHACHTNDTTCFKGEACLHRRCVNPAHLELVSGYENKLRAHRPEVDTCLNGHPMEGENLYIHDGNRHCRACRRDRAREAKRAKGAVPMVRMGETCPSGHRLDQANLWIEPGTGKKRCRECVRIRKQAWRQKMRGEGRTPT